MTPASNKQQARERSKPLQGRSAVGKMGGHNFQFASDWRNIVLTGLMTVACAGLFVSLFVLLNR